MSIKKEELLDIVDENDIVIGVAPRKDIHTTGLLHRSVHIIFVTPEGDIILQKRSMKKSTYPGVLTFAASGHVKMGLSYLQSALLEVEEETSLVLQESDLIWMQKKRNYLESNATHTIDNEWITTYATIYKGKMDQLNPELGEVDGFVSCPLKNLLAPTEEEKNSIQPICWDQVFYGDVYQKIEKIIAEN